MGYYGNNRNYSNIVFSNSIDLNTLNLKLRILI